MIEPRPFAPAITVSIAVALGLAVSCTVPSPSTQDEAGDPMGALATALGKAKPKSGKAKPTPPTPPPPKTSDAKSAKPPRKKKTSSGPNSRFSSHLFSAKERKQLVDFQAQLDAITPKQASKLRCRVARTFAAQKDVVRLSLREANAGTKQIQRATKAMDDIAKDVCGGGDGEAAIARLGGVFIAVNRKFTKGTSLEGDWVVMEGFADLMRGFADQCFDPSEAVGVNELATMSESEFSSKLDGLAFGKCSGSVGALGASAGNPFAGRSGSSSPYGECVRDAFRDSAFPPTDCSDIAGYKESWEDAMRRKEEEGLAREQARQAESARPSGQAQGGAQGMSQAQGGSQTNAHDRQDQRSYNRGTAQVVAGVIVLNAGSSMVVGGLLGAPFTAGASLGLSGAGVGVAAIGVDLIMGGEGQRDTVERDYVERTGSLFSERQCPSFSSSSGVMAYAGEGGARMTVMDAMQACRCEHNPLDKLIGSSAALGAFGGPRCELGKRLECLREGVDDTGEPMSAACRRQLRRDNSTSIAAQVRDCMVVNCGPDAAIGADCRCTPLGRSGAPGLGERGGLDPCAFMQTACQPPAVPVADGGGCTCSGGATAPEIDPGLGPGQPGN